MMQPPLRCLVIAQNAITAEIIGFSLSEASARPVEIELLSNPWEPPVDIWPALSRERFDLIIADVLRATWAMYDWLREVGAERLAPIAVGMLGVQMTRLDRGWYDDLQPAAVLPRGAGPDRYRRMLRSLDIAVKLD